MGIAPAQAAQSWETIEDELVEISFEDQNSWLLKPDLSRLLSPPIPTGIRFLPPHDPYLQLRDRATLVQDKGLQQKIWRATGNPGVMIAKGRLAGLWRSHKKGSRLVLMVERFVLFSQNEISQIEEEAESLAPYKRCTQVEVAFTKD